MSWLSKGTKTVTNIAKPILGGVINSITGQPQTVQPGAANPFAPPDLSFLKTKLDLTKGYKPIDTSKSDALFKDLLTSIGGENQNDTEKLNLLLGDIGIDEKNTVGNLKSDFQDRGLGGPGQISDIEANTIAQTRSGADRTRAGARTEFAGKGLDRLMTAYGTRYGAGLDTAKTDAGIYNDLLKTSGLSNSEQTQTLARLLSELYSSAARNQTDAYIPAKPGLLESIINNFGPSFGQSLGKSTGSGAGQGILSMFGG